MTHTVHATPISRVYRKMKSPAFVGQLRSKTWKLGILTGDEAQNPLWINRCREYWERQEALFGLRFASQTSIMVDVDPDAGPCLTTHAVVVEVLPGERVEGMKLQ